MAGFGRSNIRNVQQSQRPGNQKMTDCVLSGELSLRQACHEYRLNFRTVHKIVHHPEPPLYPYQQTRSRPKPVLGPFLPIVHQILRDDRHAPPEQSHTARRIYERLREEHGYPGCPSIVRAAVADWQQSQAEVFVPLPQPSGEPEDRERIFRPSS
jgi:hypothetical protein